jgi:hypothetical protein
MRDDDTRTSRAVGALVTPWSSGKVATPHNRRNIEHFEDLQVGRRRKRASVVVRIPWTAKGQKLTRHHHVQVTFLRIIVIIILRTGRAGIVRQTPCCLAVTTGHKRAWRGAEHSGSTTGASYLMLIEGLEIVQAGRYSPHETCPVFLHVQIVRAFHPGSVSVRQAHCAVGRVLERLEGPPRLFRCCSQVQAQKGAEKVDGVCHVPRVLRCIVHYPKILQLRVQHRLHQRLADVVQGACADRQRGAHTTRDRAR